MLHNETDEQNIFPAVSASNIYNYITILDNEQIVESYQFTNVNNKNSASSTLKSL